MLTPSPPARGSAESGRTQAEAELAAAFDAYRVTDGQLREAESIVAGNVVAQRGLTDAVRREVASAAGRHDLAVEDREAAEAVLDTHESVVVDFVVATYIARPEQARDLERLPTPHRQPPPIDPMNDRFMADVHRSRAEIDRLLEIEREAAAELARREAELAEQESAVTAAADLERSFHDAVADRNQAIEDRKAEIIAAESSETPLVMVQGFRVNAAIAEDLAALLDDAASLGEDWVEPAHCSEPEPEPEPAAGAEAAPEREPEPEPTPEPTGDQLESCERPTPIIFGGGAYRPRTNQITLRIAHCGTSEYLIFDAPSSGCSPPTARPGRSQHELGLAIDFTENGQILSRSSPGYRWLVENAERYGLKNLPSEPWHWSTTGW